MPSYTVPINGENGPGFMTVNASSPEAAMENAGQGGGNYATGAAVEGGHQAHTGAGGTAVAGYPAGYDAAGQIAGRTTLSAGDQQSLNQLIAGQEAMLKAIADGNMEAFREAVRQFDLSFGLDQNKFQEAVRQFNASLGVTEAGLTGTYQGMQTLQARELQFRQALDAAGLTGVYQGQPTLQAQNQAYTQGLGLINQVAALQANPFRQQTAMGQMSRLLGGQSVAGFGQIGTVPGAGTGGLGYLQQMIDDIRDPSANTAHMNEVLAGIPTPNKLDSTQFFRSPTTTQNLVLQGMQEKYGIDPNDALQQIKNTMPGFQSPNTFGTIRR
jgi:hypothetical protein